uniref:ATP synthase F0 subunit 8 n=1 Tax=Monodontina vondembuschiana TaxID=2508272 RepID=A0A513X0E3_9BIVA|nr:ATP synthase F0 subunit 8 [Monodontina vondembuschiana]QDH07403.1 ATP synthase F0 subunit 8 [Monodontina vondembuschiana]
MPQLSPMSWVMVVFFFVICWAVVVAVFWWGFRSEYRVSGGKAVGSSTVSGKKGWRFGVGLKLGS